SYDPLNHFAGFEKYMQQQTEEAKKAFVSLVRNELPAETFAELAIWYYNAGYAREALKVFSLGPKSAEATFWKAFLQHKKADCAAINPELVFCFRSETATVLEHLL